MSFACRNLIIEIQEKEEREGEVEEYDENGRMRERGRRIRRNKRTS